MPVNLTHSRSLHSRPRLPLLLSPLIWVTVVCACVHALTVGQNGKNAASMPNTDSRGRKHANGDEAGRRYASLGFWTRAHGLHVIEGSRRLHERHELLLVDLLIAVRIILLEVGLDLVGIDASPLEGLAKFIDAE